MHVYYSLDNPWSWSVLINHWFLGILMSLHYIGSKLEWFIPTPNSVCYGRDRGHKFHMSMHNRCSKSCMNTHWADLRERLVALMMSMAQCKKGITPLLMQWSYVFLAQSHRYSSCNISVVRGMFTIFYAVYVLQRKIEWQFAQGTIDAL